MSNNVIDIRRLEEAVAEIAKQISEMGGSGGSITLPLSVDNGGTGVTTVEAIRTMIISQSQEPLDVSKMTIAFTNTEGYKSTVWSKSNIILGYNILKAAVQQTSDTVIVGAQAMETANAGGINNTIIGSKVFQKAKNTAISDIRDAVAIGYDVGRNMVDGGALYSVIVGSQALQYPGEPLSFNRSVAIGYSAAEYSTGTIVACVFIGDHSGSYLKSGSLSAQDNVAIGSYALCTNTSSATNTSYNAYVRYCTAVGAYALTPARSGTMEKSTALGYDAQVTGNNQVQLGGSGSTTYAYGSVQNRSDERDKTNITDLEYDYTSFIMGLRPVNFQWDYREDYRGDPSDEDYDMKPLSEITHDGTHIRSRRHNGFIAQEVKELMDSLGFDFAGYQDHSVNGGDDVLSLGYEEFMAPLIKLVQDQQRTIQGHQSQIAELKAAIADLQKINS